MTSLSDSTDLAALHLTLKPGTTRVKTLSDLNKVSPTWRKSDWTWMKSASDVIKVRSNSNKGSIQHEWSLNPTWIKSRSDLSQVGSDNFLIFNPVQLIQIPKFPTWFKPSIFYANEKFYPPSKIKNKNKTANHEKRGQKLGFSSE